MQFVDSLYNDIVTTEERCKQYAEEYEANGFQSEISDAVESMPAAKDMTAYVNDSKYTVAIHNASIAVDNTILKSTHVEYAITITRSSDSEAVTIMRRYKDIFSWYKQLIYLYPFIQENRAVQFPTYSEKWFAGSAAKNDVEGEFVQKRRLDLQTFFRLLFYQYPPLFEDNHVSDFLELSNFSPAASSSHASSLTLMSSGGEGRNDSATGKGGDEKNKDGTATGDSGSNGNGIFSSFSPGVVNKSDYTSIMAAADSSNANVYAGLWVQHEDVLNSTSGIISISDFVGSGSVKQKEAMRSWQLHPVFPQEDPALTGGAAASTASASVGVYYNDSVVIARGT